MGRYAIPVITRLLSRQGGRFADDLQADRALYWYVHAAVRGRFAGSTETYLARDLETVDADGIDGVIASLSRARKGAMTIDPIDFEGVGRGSRSYPLLYLLSRVLDARDLSTGSPLDRGASDLEVHEIFPKTQLVRHGFARSEVSAIANFAFITPESARDLRWLAPHYYLAECSPEVLASQWIPQDPKLWQIESFREFLDRAPRAPRGGCDRDARPTTRRHPLQRRRLALGVRHRTGVTGSAALADRCAGRRARG